MPISFHQLILAAMHQMEVVSTESAVSSSMMHAIATALQIGAPTLVMLMEVKAPHWRPLAVKTSTSRLDEHLRRASRPARYLPGDLGPAQLR